MVSGPEALASSTRLPGSMPEVSDQLQAGLGADFEAVCVFVRFCE